MPDSKDSVADCIVYPLARKLVSVCLASRSLFPASASDTCTCSILQEPLETTTTGLISNSSLIGLITRTIARLSLWQSGAGPPVQELRTAHVETETKTSKVLSRNSFMVVDLRLKLEIEEAICN